METKRPVITLPNYTFRPATDDEWRNIESERGNITHRLIRRNSDWEIVCGDCNAEFWAAGSSVADPCAFFPRERV